MSISFDEISNLYKYTSQRLIPFIKKVRIFISSERSLKNGERKKKRTKTEISEGIKN